MARQFTYDVDRMLADAAVKGWLRIDLARHAGLGRRQVYRFFSGESSSARVAERLTYALGKKQGHYLIRPRMRASA